MTPVVVKLYARGYKGRPVIDTLRGVEDFQLTEAARLRFKELHDAGFELAIEHIPLPGPNGEPCAATLGDENGDYAITFVSFPPEGFKELNDWVLELPSIEEMQKRRNDVVCEDTDPTRRGG